MPTLMISEMTAQEIKVMKERSRVEKARHIFGTRNDPPTVTPWVVVCETCHIELHAQGGSHASEVADDHLRANASHRMQLYSVYKGKRRKVMSREWTPRLGFDGEDIRR